MTTIELDDFTGSELDGEAPCIYIGGYEWRLDVCDNTDDDCAPAMAAAEALISELNALRAARA